MRNGLPGKEKFRFFGSLKSIVLFIGLVVFGGNAVGQTVCAGSTLTGTEVMDEMGIVDPGHRNGGNYSYTTVPAGGGLNFSTQNENAVISGFSSSYESYEITYTKGTDSYSVVYYIQNPLSVAISANNATDVCTTPYNPEINIEVEGAPDDDWVVVFEITDGSGNSNQSVTVSDNADGSIDGIGTMVYTFGGVSEDTNYEVTGVYPQGNPGCPMPPPGGGWPSITYTVGAITQYNVTGSNLCANGSNSVTIGVSDSEVGVTYWLQRDGADVTDVAGTGNPITFPAQDVSGVYTVVGRNATCPAQGMNGLVEISAMPADQAFVTTGIVCYDTNPVVELSAAEAGVQYRLYKDGVYTNRADAAAPIQFDVTDEGTYTIFAVTLDNNNNIICSLELSDQLVVENPATFNLSAIGGVSSYCSGTSPTGIDLQLSGTESGTSYRLYNQTTLAYVGGTKSNNGPPISWSDVPAGTYHVEAIAPSGCSKNMGNVTVTASTLPTANISIDPLNDTWCESETVDNNVVQIDFTSPSNPVILEIRDDKGNTTTINNIITSPYTFPDPSRPADPVVGQVPSTTTTYEVVSITSAIGCSNSGTGAATINIVSNPTFNITGPSEICENGSATLDVANLNLPPANYDFLWSTAATTQAITVSPAANTNYEVTVTNSATGCFSTQTHSVTVNPLPVVSFSGLDPTHCVNGPLDPLTGTPNGGDFFLDGVQMATNSFDPSTNLGTHDIYYSYTDANGCTDVTPTQSTTVSDITPVSFSNLPAIICTDSPPIDISGAPFGGTVSVISGGGGLDATANADGTLTISPGTSTQGIYDLQYVFSNGNGCVSSVTASTEIVDMNSGLLDIEMYDPSTSNQVPDLIFCPDDNTNYDLQGLVNNSSIYPGNGDFSGSGVTDATAGDGVAVFNPQDAFTADGLGNHDISFTYETPEGCVGVATITIQIGVDLSTTPAIGSYYCEADAPVVIQGNPAGGSFEIDRPTQSTYTTTDNFTIDPALWANDPGDYTITYRYDDPAILPGCTIEESWTTTITAEVDASFSFTPTDKTNFCANDNNAYQLELDDGGITPDVLTFSGNGIFGEEFRPSDAGPGTHTLSAEVIINGCSSTSTKTVNVEPIPSLNFVNLQDEYCESDPQFEFTVDNAGETGTFAFSSVSSIPGQNPLSLTGNDASRYFDPGVGEGTYIVEYSFTPDATSTTQCPVTVTKTVIVHRADDVAINNLVSDYCNNESPITISGTFGPGDFYINDVLDGPGITNNGSNTAEFDPSVLTPGTYDIKYTYDNGNCTDSEVNTVTIHKAPQPYTVQGGGYICTGSGSVLPVGLDDTQNDVTYELYLNGSSFSPSVTFAGDGNANSVDVSDFGTYTIWGEDDNTGCRQAMTGQVDVTESIVSVTVATTNPNCHGGNGTITATATGGVGDYNYVWEDINDPADNTDDVVLTLPVDQSVINVPVGNYRVTVTDDNGAGCSDVFDNITIAQPSELNISVSTTASTCSAVNDGTAQLNITGGVTPYSITWPSGNSDVIETGLAQGSYTVLVTDDNGCSKIKSFTIAGVNDLMINSIDNIQHVTCFNDADGSFEVTAEGASGNLEFSVDNTNWFDNGLVDNGDGTFTYTFDNLAAGDYDVYIRNANTPGCFYQYPSKVTINEPSQLNLSLISSSDETCFGLPDDGAIEVQASGGTSPYQYSFDGGVTFGLAGDNSINGLSSGSYNVIARDANNCIATLSSPVVINEPDELVIDSYSVTDVSCHSGNDGSISVIAKGGNGNYVYSLSGDENRPNQPSPTFSGLEEGSYNVTVTDGESCSYTYSDIVVGEPDNALAITTTSEPTGCSGTSEGEVTVSISGGTPFSDLVAYPSGYDIQWNDAVGDPVDPALVTDNGTRIENVAAGNFTVTITDVNGCNISEVVTIGVVADIVLTENSHTNVSCRGGSDGQIVVSASGGQGIGTANYQFSLDQSNWFAADVGDPDDNTRTFSNLSAGSYDVYVRDANYPNCEYQLGTPLTITQPAALTVAELVGSHVNVDCNGNNTGQFEVEANGGTGPYRYYINGTINNPDPNSGVFTNLNSGFYTVHVEDANGCVANMAQVEITENDPVNITDYTVTDVSCNSGNDGSISVTAIGGDGNYVYSLTDGTNTWPNQASNTFSGLENGTYDVTVTDGSGCSTSYNGIDVDEPSIAISLSTAVDQNVLCRGGNSGAFTVTASGGSGGYEFSIDGGTTWNTDNTNAYTFDNLSAGTYTVDVRDAKGCIESTTESITQPAVVFSLTASVANHITCHDGNDGEVSVSGNGGASATGVDYVLYKDVAGSWVPQGTANESTLDPAFSGLTAGDYRIDAFDDNGCSDSQNITINQPAAEITLSVDNINNVITPGGNDGSIEISISGGSGSYPSIDWSGEDEAGVDISAGLTDDIFTQPNLIAGTYTVEITDGNGCTFASDPIVVTDPDSPLAVTVATSEPGPCFGATNGTISVTATGGVPPYASVTLSRGGTVIAPASSGADYANYNNLGEGTYEIEVVDDAGNIFTSTEVFDLPDELIVNLNVDQEVSCNLDSDGTITFSAYGGSPDDSGTPGNSADDLYSYFITPPSGAIIAGTINVSGSETLNTISAGKGYILRIVDSEGCLVQTTFDIEEPDPITFDVDSENLSCFGSNDGEISVTIVDGGWGSNYSYAWEVRNGAAWDPYPASGQAITPTITNLPVGTYRVKVTGNLNGCETYSGNIIMTQPEELELKLSGQQNITTCNGDNSGEVTLRVEGGTANYDLTGSATNMNWTGVDSYVASGLSGGTNTFTVQDSEGCTSSVSTDILEPEPLVVNSVDAQIECETDGSDGEVIIEVSGGSADASGDYSYRIELENQTTGNNQVWIRTSSAQPYTINDITGILPGDYDLTITDANSSDPSGCSYTDVINLSYIEVDETITPETCKGGNDGEIDITVSGGSGNYTYSWSTPSDPSFSETTQDISGLIAGTYDLDLVDVDRGCTVNKSYVVNTGKVLSIEASVNTVSCNGGSNGAIIVNNVQGATAPITYYWDGVAGSDQLTNLSSGSYELVVEDADGCQVTQSFFVPQPAAIDFSLSTNLDDCTAGSYDRSVEVDGLTGGTAPYTYVWEGPGSFVDNSGDISGITTGGYYEVTITDTKGCTAEDSISVYGDPVLSADVTPIQCNGGTNGIIQLNVTGGSGSYTYAWIKQGEPAFNATTKDLSGVSAGIFEVVVTDNMQLCTSGDPLERNLEIVVGEPDPIVVDSYISNVTCGGGDSDGEINITAINGGAGSYTLNWSASPYITAGAWHQTDLPEGEYTVVISDASGCSVTRKFTIDEPDPLDFTLDVSPTNCAGANEISISGQTGGTGTYEFSWAGPGIPAGFNGMSQTDLPGGEYTVTMVDVGNVHNCNISKTVTLTKALDVTYSVQPEICPGSNTGAIDITPVNGVGPYTYSWSTTDGSGLSATNEDQSGLSAGTYEVTVTDSNPKGPCTFTISDIEVAEANTITVANSITHVRCLGGSTGAINIDVTGGSGAYNYSWSGPNGFTSNAEDISGLEAGSYTVVVTDDISGTTCSVTKTYSVTEPADFIEVTGVDVTEVLCHGEATGAIDITVSGGTAPYEYQWVGPGTISDPTNEDLSDIRSGNYNVHITDANGCVLDYAAVYGDSINVPQPDEALDAYTVNVNDVTTNGGSNGSIEIEVTGGFGAYTIRWVDENGDPVPASNDLEFVDNLSSGTYSVTITDENNCTTEINNIVVRQPGEPLGLIISKRHVGACSGSDNGVISVDMTGGTLPYQSITLFNGGGQVDQVTNDNGAVFRDLPAGDYEVVGIDANGVDIRSEVRILQPTPLVLNADVTTHVECYSSETGVITVSVDGGIVHSTNNDYRVSLSGGPSGTAAVQNPAASTNITFSNLPAGTYTVRVIDDSNVNEVDGSDDTWSAGYGDSSFDINSDCYLETQVTVEQPEAELTLSTVTGSEEVCEGALPTLQLITANWDFAADGNLEVALSDGETYTVDASPFQFEPNNVPAEGITQYNILTVENAAGCSKGTGSGTAVVKVHPLPVATIFGDAEMCLGEARDLGIELTGNGPWDVAISDGTNTWNETFTGTFNLFEVTPTATTTYEILSVSDSYCSNSTGVGTATVTVNELPEVTLSGSAEICEGGSTDLTFNLTNGTAPYEVTYEAVTSTGTTEHTVGPISTVSFDLAVSPDETTDYRLVSVVDANGCVQSITGEVRVTVRELAGNVTGINGNDIICQGSTHTYSIDPVTNATGYVWELPADAGTIVSGQGTTSIEIDYAIDAPETANLSVYAYNDCGDGPNYVLQINVDQLPQSIDAIDGDEDLCQGATGVRYSVPQLSDASVYNWTVPAGFTIVNGQGSSTIEVDVDPAINTTIGDITVTPENSCGVSTSSSSLEVEVHPLPDADAGSDQQLCGTSTTLDAVDPASINANWSGQWEIISGYASIASPNDPASALNDISRGNAVLVWTVTNTASGLGCSVSDTVVVRNNQLSVQADAEETLSCDGNTDLYGTIIPSYPNTSGRWTVESGSGSFDDANASGTTVYDLGPGSNTLRWTLTQNTCESYAEVVVVNDRPDQAHIDQQDTIDICDTQTILTANDPVQGTGTWSVEKGRATITTTNAAGNEIEVTNLAKGENIIRWTVTKNGNCSNYDQVVIRNNQLEVEAGDPYTTCQDIIQIEGTEPPNGVTGQWSAYGAAAGQVSFADGTAYQTVVSGLIYGENKLRWTLYKNGCESSDSVTITSHTPTLATVGSEQTICNTDTLLTGNTPAAYELGRWTIVQGSGDFENETDPQTRVSNVGLGENIYRWTIFNGNCSTSADLTVFNQQVEAFAGKDTVSCSRYVRLNAGPVPAGYTGLWTVESGSGGAVFDGSQNDPDVGVQLAPGENLLRWNVVHNQSGCSSSDVVSVLVNAIENVDAGGDQIINDGSGEATMQAILPGRASGEWSIVSGGGNIVDPSGPNTLIENLSRGPNVFRWTVTIGNCVAFDEVQITNGDVIQAETGPDIFTCSPEATMHANDPDNAIGRWTLGSFGAGKFEDERDPETRVYDLGPGENEFVWTISYGQGTSYSSDTIIVTNNQPDEARPDKGGVICDNSYTLKGNTPAPGMGTVSWRIISGSGNIIDIDQPSTLVTGLSQGENRFIYTIEKGVDHVCYSSDTVSVINGIPTASLAGQDTTLCVDSIMLDPNVPNHGSGEWRIFEGAAEFEGNLAKNIARGVNRFLWVISTEHCSSVDTVTIVNNEPSVPNAGADRPVCEDNVTLSGSLPTYHTGEWMLISGSGVIEEPTKPNSNVTGLGQGNNRFRWTITNGNCSDFDDVVIRNDFIEANIGYNNPDPLCVDTAQLKANNASPGVGTWGVLGGSGSASFDDPANPNTIVRDLDQGENVLTWSITNGYCTDIDQVMLVNNKPSTAEAGGNKETCDDYIVLAANQPEVGSGQWTIRNGSGDFSSVTSPTPRVDALSFGANIFRWTVENKGCISSDDVQIDYNTIQAVVGDDRTICADSEILSANNASPGTGTWTVAGGTSQAVFDDLNNPNTTVRNLRKGVNRLRWTVNYKGCQTFEEVSVTNSSPSTSYAGNTQRLCADETVLDAFEPEIGTGRWEVIAGSATITSDNMDNPKASVTQLAKGDNVLRWIVENDICRSQDDVLIVNNLPSTPFAGSDLEVCQPDHDLMAATPEYGEGYWSILEGGGNISDVTDPRAHIRNLSYGITRLKWTVTKGQCTLSDEIVIENNTATRANAGPDVADCKDWARLDANPALRGTGEWSIVSGRGSFVNPADEATAIEQLGFGENILMWEIWNGSKCFSRDTVVIFNKVPEQSDAGNDKVICENYTTLNGNNPPEEALGTWTVVSGAGEFDNPNSYSSIVRDIGFGNNVYKWTIAYDDCITESTVNVKSNKTDAYAGEDLVVYDPEAMLNANNVGDLDAGWSIVGGSGEFDDPDFFNTLVSGLSEGINTYRWSINVEGCNSFDDVSVEYRPVPDAGFVTDEEEGCWPLTVNFTNYSVGVQDRDYHWDFGDGNTSGDQNPVHTFEDAGDYSVVLTVPGPDGIEGYYQKIIRVNEHPEAAFDVTPREVYVPGDEVRFFDLSVGSEEYEWHFGDGTISTEAHPVHEYTESGVYDVMLHVTNEFGCTDSATIEGAVTAISKGFIKFPNAFKPRPDGGVSNRPNETNNIFEPVYRDVDTYHLQIYNRWGQLIYESDDIEEGWNGFYQGQLVPQAVYVWKVNGTFVNGTEFRETGSVLLVR